MLLDRVAERASLGSLLDDARRGWSGVLVVYGEAGIGKSALVEEVASEATDFHVARVSGLETERDLGFAALHRLLVPFLERRDVLPKPQRDALDAAFGLVAATPPDRFLVGLAVLTLLSAVGQERPLLCLVDDAQWLDRESADLLAFVGRRLQADRIVIVFCVHDPSEATFAKDLPALRLDGLPEDDGLELLARAVGGPLDARTGRSIVTETDGNPLALIELATELSGAQLAGTALLPAPLPVGRQLEDRFVRQLRELPLATQQLLVLAAAEPSGDPNWVMRAAAHAEIAMDASDPAEAAGLLEPGSALRFRHGLIRSVVYAAASPAERRAAHAALAATATDASGADRRAWHLASATVERDEAVAVELEQSAARARARGGYAAEAAALARAAELTPDAMQRARRLLSASRASLMAGAPHQAESLLEQATALRAGSVAAALAKRLRGLIRLLLGEPADATRLLLGAVRELEPLDLRLARDTLLEALEAALAARHLATEATLDDVAHAAVAMPKPLEQDVTVADRLVDGFSLRVAVGYAESVPVLRRAITALATQDVGTETRPRWSSFSSLAAHELWDDINHRALLARFERLDRDQGALNSLRVTLVTLGSCAMYEGRFSAAEAHHAEARDITTAIGGDTTMWGLMNVELLAWQGRGDETRDAVDALVRTSTERGVGSALNIAAMAMSVLELGESHYAEALAHARRVFEDDPPAFGNQVLPTVVEAGTRGGDQAIAALALDRLAERATVSGTPWALGLLARSRALMAGEAEAEALYEEAIALLERTVITTDVARARLVYGEWLRRQNRRVEAREQLREAYEAFLAMGAASFANRARIELAATGERARKRTVEAAAALTPQETQIANLAAYGATNPEIAAQLFISPNTVEYHLRKVFRKLNISSRRHLARALPA